MVTEILSFRRTDIKLPSITDINYDILVTAPLASRGGGGICQENSLEPPPDIYKTYPENNYPFGTAISEIFSYRQKIPNFFIS